MVHHLKVVLRNVKPTVAREILVPSDVRLDQLHEVIQISMGWTDSHLHQFIVGGDPRNGDRYGPAGMEIEFTENERRATLQKVAPAKGAKLTYNYDFGDDWNHDITVVSVESTVEAEPGLRCLNGIGACPPEDCGGPWRYAEMLMILGEPSHEEYDDISDWIGKDWDANAFDSASVNQQLDALSGFWTRMKSVRKSATSKSRARSRPKP
jgi:hypothetical protein